MHIILSRYRPTSYDQALEAACIQSIGLAICALVLFMIAKQRFPKRNVIVALIVGACFGFLIGLVICSRYVPPRFRIPLEAWDAFTSWTLPWYLASYYAALAAFIGMLASWMSLMIVGRWGAAGL